jgi:NADH dehydrogenase FAD-containing subunit
LPALQVILKGGEALDYGICLWSTGNATRPLVQAISAQIPGQAALLGAGPVKLAVDPYLRVAGARDLVAVGDCRWALQGARGRGAPSCGAAWRAQLALAGGLGCAAAWAATCCAPACRLARPCSRGAC